MATVETRTMVLDVAQEFVQTRGFNAFSFRDVAERVGIKTASIHYYFPTKAELCRALSRGRRPTGSSRVGGDRYRGDRTAAKVDTIRFNFQERPRGRQSDVPVWDACRRVNESGSFGCERPVSSVEDHETWLERVLNAGLISAGFTFTGSAMDEAKLLVSSLEGAMLIARAFEDMARFEQSVRGLLRRLSPACASLIHACASRSCFDHPTRFSPRRCRSMQPTRCSIVMDRVRGTNSDRLRHILVATGSTSNFRIGGDPTGTQHYL